VLFNQSPYAIIAPQEPGHPCALRYRGQNLGVAEGDLSIRLWPAVARQNGIKIASVKQNSTSAPPRADASAGQVDAVTGFFYLRRQLEDRGVPADDLAVFRYADYELRGLRVASSSIRRSPPRSPTR